MVIVKKNYSNYYSPDAKKHNEDIGGVCPLRQFHCQGMTIPNKSSINIKNICNNTNIDLIDLTGD